MLLQQEEQSNETLLPFDFEGFTRFSVESRIKEEQGELCRGVALLAWSCSPTQGC